MNRRPPPNRTPNEDQDLHFLPWLRRGLGRTLSNPDPTFGELPRNAPIEASVDINEVQAQATLALRPVDHATGIDLGQIVRRYPAAGTVDAEYGYFPLVDVTAPDLPWVLTPAAPSDDGDSRLRPWLVLVCVEDNADVELVPGADGRPARLFVEGDQLPNLAESDAWAHVQGAVAPNQVETALTDNPGAVLARLVCPLRLKPNTRYRLAVVAAFAADGDDAGTVVPAWPRTGGTEELIVYDTWTMSTGGAGSFEELCERLGPVEDPDLVLGLHRTDVTELGPLDPWPPDTERVTVDYAGAMWDTDVEPAGLGAELADDFADALTPQLRRTDQRAILDLDAPDPVVAPPYYGSFAAAFDILPRFEIPEIPRDIPGGDLPRGRPGTELPDDIPDGWLHRLNLDPSHRAAAGLGAEIVRIHQERFMAMAWQQAGQLRETNRLLSVTRLQAEVARTWKERTDRLDAHQRVAVLRPQLTFLRDEDGKAPRRSMQASTFPDALVSPAYLRVTRPGAVVATAAARRNPRGHSWDSSIGDTFGSPQIREELGIGIPVAPPGTRFDDSRGELDAADDGTGNGGPIEPDEPRDPDGPLPTLPTPPRRRRLRAGPPRRARSGADVSLTDIRTSTAVLPALLTTTSVVHEPFDLAATAALLTSTVAPIPVGRDRLTARVPGLADVVADAAADELPTRVAIGPVIDEALVWSLVELSPELVLPGVDVFPNNAVRVVETNPAFVAAFLAGANHEMARELLWREYPADLAATVFHRFWDRPDRDAYDIEAMVDWGQGDLLADIGAHGGETVVVLIRGDLVHHYPTVRVLLVDPRTQIASLPTFGGWIPPDVRFMAFDVVSADAVTAPNSGWKVVIEEQPTEPRFGLDTLAEGDALPKLTDSWNALSWSHLDNEPPPGEHLTIGGALPAGTTLDDATWGRNAAHMAVATYQAPYRLIFDVDELIGSTDD